MNGESINLSEADLRKILTFVYENMFMRDMVRIVQQIKKGNDERASVMAGDLLALYNKLAYAMINGVFSKDESK